MAKKKLSLLELVIIVSLFGTIASIIAASLSKQFFDKERMVMENSAQSARSIEVLMGTLQREGKLKGKKGELVVFDRMYKVIGIVSREDLQKILLQAREDLGGWQTVREE